MSLLDVRDISFPPAKYMLHWGALVRAAQQPPPHSEWGQGSRCPHLSPSGPDEKGNDW